MEGDTNNIFRLKTDLRNAFKAINNSGTFAGWGALPTTLPAGFLVDGSREFDLPLSEGHVRQLIAKAHQVPSGRADETTTDGAVWEVTRDELFFLEPAWQGYLVDLSRQVAAELGVDEPIRLDFHRMLIMETGAMLKPRTE
ncbi:hypothetical protein MJO29_006756 [Puccinia striiformis f. sp. tritici]|nr:hypothetical protein MJO29_006756 [Puccinia striiformis f. sp. tritici]